MGLPHCLTDRLNCFKTSGNMANVALYHIFVKVRGVGGMEFELWIDRESGYYQYTQYATIFRW